MWRIWPFSVPFFFKVGFLQPRLENGIFSASNETLVTPFNKSYFGWGTSQNALEFMMIGFCALIGYMFAKYLMATQESGPRVEPKKVFGAGVGGCVL